MKRGADRCRAKRKSGRFFGSGSAIAIAMLAAPQASGQSLDNDYWINVQAYYPKVDTTVRVTADMPIRSEPISIWSAICRWTIETSCRP